MKATKQLFSLGGIALAAVLTLNTSTNAPAETVTPNNRKWASDFTLQDANGREIRLSDYTGRVVLLDFWATWCHGCQLEIPWYMEFQTRYSARGLSVIGVAMDDDGWQAVKPFLKMHRVNYSVVLGSGSLAKRYGLESMPLTLLIDRNGRIAESHAGMVDKDAFEADIRLLLQEHPQSPIH